jgi:nitric oxide reductase NorE protein
MSAARTTVAAASRERVRRLPGEAGIWLFILGDVVVFSLFFATFLYYRGREVELFRASQAHLDQRLGLVNTLLLLTSSWLVASGLRAARVAPGRATPLCFLLALLCGVGFVAVKYFEYRAKIAAGLTLTTNDFYMFYYMFTGIHLGHVLIGIGVLAFMTRAAWAGRVQAGTIGHWESGASFWHLVDLLWIVLFALLYLLR